MADSRFFPVPEVIPLKSLVLLTGAKLRVQSDALRTIKGAAPLNMAGPDDLSFFDNRKYRDMFLASEAGACFVRPEDSELAPMSMSVLIHENPYYAYAVAADALYPRPMVRNRISEQAYIHETAKIGSGCEIRPGVVIGRDVEIGARCLIEPNVVIGKGVVIGNDCRVGACTSISHAIIGNRVAIYPGARIGQDGFGYALSDRGHLKVPQLGRVMIEDDVEIGANSTIDRGAGPDTVIGRGCIIDNLVQIAHNVVLGPGCVLISQSGVAGSSRLGCGVVVAAQGGVAGHLKVGDGAQIGAQSGVMRDIEAGTRVVGSPAQPVKQFFRQHAWLEKSAKEAGKKQT